MKDLEKSKEKGRNEEKRKELKYLYEASIPQKNPQKQGRTLEGVVGNILACQNINPCSFLIGVSRVVGNYDLKIIR